MVRKWRLWICLFSFFLMVWPASAQIRTSLKSPSDETSSAKNAKKTTSKAKIRLGAAPAVLWREPGDIKTRDLYYGPGGAQHQPAGKLSFLEEKFSGAHPKFDVQDESGIIWGVKLGKEAKPETAATRLVWAVGYFTNEDYYVPELKFPEAVRLTRGQHLVNNGKVKGARLKRHNTGETEIADWAWDDNPFVGTKELDGLKIMMEIICNTDLKKANQHVYDIEGKEQRYIAADLGVAFGKAGKTSLIRSRGDLKAYQELPLIKSAGPDYIDFWYFKHIPRAHAKWIGGYLAQLSDVQISDAFRAGGFSAEEIDGFTRKVREKINELVHL